MALTTSGNFNLSTVTTVRARTTTTVSEGVSDLFNTPDGRTVLALLLILMILVISIPIVTVILVKKYCWIKVEDIEKGMWKSKIDKIKEDEQEDNIKQTQTELTGEELQEYFNRRKPTDMSLYYGKRLVEVEEPPRFNQLNPKTVNDPWSSKYNGKETNYIARNW